MGGLEIRHCISDQKSTKRTYDTSYDVTRPAYQSSSCTQCTSTRRPTSAAPTDRFAPEPTPPKPPPPPPPPTFPGPPLLIPGLPPLKSGPPSAPGLLRGSPAPPPWPVVPAMLPGAGGAAGVPVWPLRPRPLPRPLPLPLPVDAAAPLCGGTRLGVTHASVQHLDAWRSHTAEKQQACCLILQGLLTCCRRRAPWARGPPSGPCRGRSLPAASGGPRRRRCRRSSRRCRRPCGRQAF